MNNTFLICKVVILFYIHQSPNESGTKRNCFGQKFHIDLIYGLPVYHSKLWESMKTLSKCQTFLKLMLENVSICRRFQELNSRFPHEQASSSCSLSNRYVKSHFPVSVMELNGLNIIIKNTRILPHCTKLIPKIQNIFIVIVYLVKCIVSREEE